MQAKGLVVVEDDSAAAEPVRPGQVEALAHVANRPIAHHVVDRLIQSGADEVIVASSRRLSFEVRASFANGYPGYRVPVRYVEQMGPLDLASAIPLAAPLIGSAPCIAHVASGFLAEPFAPLMDRLRGGSPDMAAVVQRDRTHVHGVTDPSAAELRLRAIVPSGPALNAAGICFFSPHALRHVNKAVTRFGTGIDLSLLAEQISAVGGRSHLLPATSWCRYAGNPLDLLELNRAALDQIEGDEHPPVCGGSRIEGRVRIHKEASVRDSVIVGPAVIAAGARVCDTYIGPYTSIGAGAHIEGAEIERSIVSPRATIIHIGARLTASVVGQDARIFRDFSLPRALRLRVGEGTEVGLC